MFLSNLKVTQDEYILILCSYLLHHVLLLKKSPFDGINAFAKLEPELWHANIDVQFILDAYVAVTYCSSYITKMDCTKSIVSKKII